ncbi:response regulator [Halalkalibacter sp. AB-rgal2]|uniref:response regulator transcription factor n=1 Tax=Halalkalibacter sp. AB-rgal2 TaxID=3242695 RepID=UPI00359E7AC2
MNSMNVIVVEDEARIRRGIERLIEQNQNEWSVVGSYADGQKAFDGIRSTNVSFDVLITDIKMPKMDGLQLIESLKKEQYVFLPVVISGFDDFNFLQNAIRQGAVDYMLKPINRKTFAEQLERLKGKVVEMKGQIELDDQVIYSRQIQKLSELIWMKETDLSQLQWVKQFPNGTYTLAYISMDDPQLNKHEDKEEQAKKLEAIEKELDHLRVSQLGHSKFWWWRGDHLSYWILLMEVVESGSQKEYMNQLHQSLQKQGSLSVALSDSFEELSLIPVIRDQLLSRIQMRLVLGGNRIFSPGTLESLHDPNDESVIPNDLYQMVQHLSVTIEKVDLVQMDKMLARFFVNLQQCESAHVVMKVVQFYITTVYNQVVSNYEWKSSPLEDVLYKIKKAANFEELKSIVLNWTRAIIKSKSMSENEWSPIDRAKEWIIDHLHENITISKVAEQIHMNPNYFCEVFKNETGETILDFVTKKKMVKAKQLLIQTDKKVYDIATEVGYKDTKYFSRLFKQYMGEVPSRYRELQKNV